MAENKTESSVVKPTFPPVEVDGVPVPVNQRRGWMMGYDGPMWYPTPKTDTNNQTNRLPQQPVLK